VANVAFRYRFSPRRLTRFSTVTVVPHVISVCKENVKSLVAVRLARITEIALLVIVNNAFKEFVR
jgi:hypothetical protein